MANGSFAQTERCSALAQADQRHAGCDGVTARWSAILGKAIESLSVLSGLGEVGRPRAPTSRCSPARL